MQELFNYCSMHNGKELASEQDELNLFIESLKLNGIEQRIYQPIEQVNLKEQTVGVHLDYWPEWLDFYYGHTSRLERSFASLQQQKTYYNGAENVEQWLEKIKANLLASLATKPKYLVWHVANAGIIEAFTYKFNYTDEQVICSSAELFNNVCDIIPSNVTVLFENLWWPGLRLVDPLLVDKFFSLLKFSNVGIMLDTGHLMNTNVNLSTEVDGINYILSTVNKLGSLKSMIQGIHLNLSLSGSYQKSFLRVAPKNLSNERIFEHINAIDGHLPFSDCSTAKILEIVQPKFLIHELYYNSFSDLKSKLAQQQKAVGLRR